jgi:membrane protein
MSSDTVTSGGAISASAQPPTSTSVARPVDATGRQGSPSDGDGRMPLPAGSPRRGLLGLWLRGTGRVCARTFKICMRHRVTGLAAEAAFWALLSLPPLALGLVGTLGYLHGVLGAKHIDQIQHAILNGASTVLSQHGVNEVVAPMLNSVLHTGRADVVSIGFLIALWSGSRAMNVYVDTITIMYGLSGRRGIIRTRALAFLLYLVGLALGAVAVPLAIIGPQLIGDWWPSAAGLVHIVYWPVLLLLSVAFLNTLYHLAVPERTPWVEDLPGTVVAMLIWLGGSALLHLYLTDTVSGSSLYGQLAAPVAALFWLYVTAMAVLIGAALNAAVDQLWPQPKLARRTSRRDRRQVVRLRLVRGREAGALRERPARERPAQRPTPDHPLDAVTSDVGGVDETCGQLRARSAARRAKRSRGPA